MKANGIVLKQKNHQIRLQFWNTIGKQFKLTYHKIKCIIRHGIFAKNTIVTVITSYILDCKATGFLFASLLH